MKHCHKRRGNRLLTSDIYSASKCSVLTATLHNLKVEIAPCRRVKASKILYIISTQISPNLGYKSPCYGPVETPFLVALAPNRSRDRCASLSLPAGGGHYQKSLLGADPSARCLQRAARGASEQREGGGEERESARLLSRPAENPSPRRDAGSGESDWLESPTLVSFWPFFCFLEDSRCPFTA